MYLLFLKTLEIIILMFYRYLFNDFIYNVVKWRDLILAMYLLPKSNVVRLPSDDTLITR